MPSKRNFFSFIFKETAVLNCAFLLVFVSKSTNNFCILFSELEGSPAKRAEYTPGFPPKLSTSRPVSSAKQLKPNFLVI